MKKTLTNEVNKASVPGMNVTVNVKSPMSWCDDYRNVYHYHRELEFVYVDEGSLVCGTGPDSFKIRKGDVIFFASRTPHYTFTDEHGSARSYLQFESRDFSGESVEKETYLARFLRGGDQAYRVFPKGTKENDEIAGYLKTVFSEFSKKDVGYESYICGGICALMGALYRTGTLTDRRNEAKPMKILPAIRYIDEHSEEDLSLEKVAQIAGFSTYHFCRLFKKELRTSFSEYLNFVRMCKSEKLLADTGRQIADIAREVGFSTPTNYNRVFKKIKGVTPTEYRKAKYT